jgi:N-acetylmuramoyl-L-alanine amidase
LRASTFRRPALLLLAALLPSPARALGEPVVVLTEKDRRELLPVVRGSVEMAPLPPLLSAFGIAAAADPRKGSLTLSREGREVVLYDGKSLMSVEGDLRLLAAPASAEPGGWLVPLDALARLLPPLLGARVEWRASARVLVVGNVRAARVSVATQVTGEAVRVVFESSERTPFHVAQAEGRVTVTVGRDLVDVAFTDERLTGGIAERVHFRGGPGHAFVIALGRRFQELRAAEEPGPPSRLVLELRGAPLAVPASPPPPVARPPVALPPRTAVIDPGHGGSDLGARGPAGAMEKDVALSLARRLRAALVNSLGMQAFLTRDSDRDVALDERVAVANNYKADVFISLHANASRSRGARGAEVYFLSYQSVDEETRRLAVQEGELPEAPAGSDLSLILWDMAQAEHLEESSALASRIQEELAEVTGSQGRGIKQAPFRVLVGATMPAVLIEAAFISNAEEEKLLVSDAYQARLVAAITRGLARFQQQRAQAPAPARAPSGRRP